MLPWLKKGLLSGEMSENYEPKKKASGDPVQLVLSVRVSNKKKGGKPGV